MPIAMYRSRIPEQRGAQIAHRSVEIYAVEEITCRYRKSEGIFSIAGSRVLIMMAAMSGAGAVAARHPLAASFGGLDVSTETK